MKRRFESSECSEVEVSPAPSNKRVCAYHQPSILQKRKYQSEDDQPVAKRNCEYHEPQSIIAEQHAQIYEYLQSQYYDPDADWIDLSAYQQNIFQPKWNY